MPKNTDAATNAATITIHFNGLCLFAKAPNEEIIHVFLGQPQHLPPAVTRELHGAPHAAAHDKTHLPTLCTKKGTGWSASRIRPGAQLEYGNKGAKVDTMPAESEMTNLAKLLGGGGLPRSEAKPDTTVKGPHVILYGGRLAVTSGKDIGVWDAELPDRTVEVRFPYMLTWTGSAGSNQQDELQIWNAMEKESPTIGNPTTFPTCTPNSDEAAEIAQDHFKAYFHILKKFAPKIKFKGTWKPAGIMKLAKEIQTIIVSSCPSSFIDLD